MKFVCFYELLSSQSRYTYQVHMELQRISLYILETIIKININKNKIMQKKKEIVYIYTYKIYNNRARPLLFFYWIKVSRPCICLLFNNIPQSFVAVLLLY